MEIDDIEPESGVIESVSLKNFMCYSNFKIEFCPFVNAVIGRNGSGKSSLLLAIRIALGGKVSPCGKVVALKKTIQQGKLYAEVSVTLRNSGNDAFQRHKYGPQIIVERRIVADGSSTFRIKDSTGHIVTTKREDLDAILCTFNIQVDNPIGILTQTMSKSFLNVNDPKEKYQLFSQATQLHIVERNYTQCFETINQVAMVLNMKNKNLDSLRSEIKELESEKENILSIEKQQEQMRKRLEEYAWADVCLQEEFTEQILKLVHKRSSVVENASKHLAESEKNLAKARKDKSKMSVLAKTIRDQANMLGAQLQTLSRKVSDIAKEIRVIKNDQNMCIRNTSAQEKKVKDIEMRIAGSRERFESTVMLRRSEIETTILERSGKKKRYEERMEVLLKDLEGERKAIVLKNQELLSLNLRLNNIAGDCNSKNKLLHKLKECKSNQMLAYGRPMLLVLQKIMDAVNEGVFTQKPIGPLGHYVKVTDRKWTLAVECCLGTNLLKTFLCDNISDQERLQEIMQKVLPNGMTYQIITSKFANQVYDVENSRVYSDEYPCVLDVLKVDHPIILNSLIDARGIENILLIPKAPTARQIMSTNPPERCTEAFTCTGISVYPYPNYRYYSSHKRTATLICGPMVAHDTVMEELKSLQHTRELVEKDRNLTNERLSLLVKNSSKIEEKIQRVNELIKYEILEIQELENTEVPDDCNVEQEEQELSQAKQELEHLLKKKTDFVIKFQKKNQQLKDTVQERNSIKKKFFDKKAELTNFVREQFMPSRTINQIDHQRMRWKKEYDTSVKRLAQALEAYKTENAELQCRIAEAEKLCSRVETSEEPHLIKIAIEEIRKSIEEIVKKSPNLEVIAESYRKKKAEYEATSKEIVKLQDVIKKQQEMLKVRHKVLENIRQCICLRVIYLFTTTLYLRHFVGRLQFDHENRSLVIDAHVSVSKDRMSTRALSGGEKSYVTVAFLLALWDAVELPFRIMDEYDVFMDQRTRQKSTELMVNTTVDHNKQFIFFSPCSVQLEESDKIRITYLKSPRPPAKKQKKK